MELVQSRCSLAEHCISLRGLLTGMAFETPPAFCMIMSLSSSLACLLLAKLCKIGGTPRKAVH